MTEIYHDVFHPATPPLLLIQGATQVNVTGSSSTAPSITLNNVVGPSSALVGFAAIYDANTTWSLADDDNGASMGTLLSEATRGADKVLSAISLSFLPSAGSHTITYTLSGTSGGANRRYVLGLLELTGLSTAVDAFAGSSNIDASGAVDASAGPITSSHYSSVYVGLAAINGDENDVTFASPAGWSAVYRQNAGVTYVGLDAAIEVAGPPTPLQNYTAQWSHDNSPNMVVCAGIIGIKPGASR